VNLAWALKGWSKDGNETLVLAKGVRKRNMEERIRIVCRHPYDTTPPSSLFPQIIIHIDVVVSPIPQNPVSVLNHRHHRKCETVHDLRRDGL
jgi:hypothetical protein